MVALLPPKEANLFKLIVVRSKLPLSDCIVVRAIILKLEVLALTLARGYRYFC
ncbi:hypothetical protein SLEP1_g21543 [Rubroshorea leprosula]|uniref:Uncharacterized protein n=1 Tax=Rubroshorea leprosula TaxID=152421 RepID=A0AAV5J695_9ROSI|nr:hypothetical protein SLEP1_g21543 [Rubroshorea leprosula]